MRFFFWNTLSKATSHTSVLYLLYHCFALLYVQHLFGLVNKRRTKRQKEEKRKKRGSTTHIPSNTQVCRLGNSSRWLELSSDLCKIQYCIFLPSCALH
ncbi:hypothetical protein BDV33DRAFT_133486 [Aspergillus novoparasiticus]|uniref:Uncharacterized protein n=1 Tax=Aspergillus novoparasiticus TaxID=986946 RepID=A0A5N6EKK2_9EURO|nr:hypothetical protein BDV33DRAFT_133486 [Aspergillus novoparasiticus]